ncbi:arginyl-tRNA synthetase [Lentinula lateritia]|uniref:Arginyl-tRNA synthetase n=1 Tax=Lentinula aff. lateritia TaxID=2804960 RepID=A0ACC1U215_9AGAR|nr:arginyl-tRNA synthetase [Lentinula aff. lateritia]KAJ3853230.1 arginyl-tRNA synthetase [Lentinula lateritia]
MTRTNDHLSINPESSCLDAYRSSIATQISSSLGIPLSTAYEGVDYGKKGIDFTVAIPRFRLKEKPAILADKVVSEFTPNEYLQFITRDGIFIHYICHTTNLIRTVLKQIFTLSKPTGSHPHGSYGCNNSGSGKQIVIEFSSPNIAKPFHAGHLRSTIIGTFLANLFDANGWKTIRLNYLGDWGKQYGLLAIGFHRYGSEEKLTNNAILHLFEVYVRVNKDVENEKENSPNKFSPTNQEAKELFKKMEDNDKETLDLWKRFRDLSIVEYEKLYRRLNVRFDVYGGESLVKEELIMESLGKLKSKNLLTKKTERESRIGAAALAAEAISDEQDTGDDDQAPDALALDFDQYNLGKPVVQKGDGTTIYILRDIAGARQRYQLYNFDKMIYVIGDQQDLHVRQFFKALSLMEEPFADELEHVNFGKIHGMSSRKGEVKFLSDILDASKEAMLDQMKKNDEKMKDVTDPEYTSDEVGMTCVKIQDMSAKRAHAYTFDLQRMTSFEGDTGAYLQYAHVRLCSVQRKVALDGIIPRDNPDLIDTTLLIEPKVRELVFALASYPDVVKTAMKNYEPSTIVSYCFKISHLVSSAWETLIVRGQETELAQARLYVFQCTRSVLASAMRLLSLTPLDRM